MKKILILLLGILLLGCFVYSAGSESISEVAITDGVTQNGNFFQLTNVSDAFEITVDGKTESLIQDIDTKKPATVKIDENNQITEMEMTAGKDTQIKINGEFVNLNEGMIIKYKNGGYEVYGGKDQTFSYGKDENLLTDITFTQPDQEILVGKDKMITGENLQIGKDNYLYAGGAEVINGKITKLDSDTLIAIKGNDIYSGTGAKIFYDDQNGFNSVEAGKGAVNFYESSTQTQITFKNVEISPLESKTRDYKLSVTAEEKPCILTLKGNEIEASINYGAVVSNGPFGLKYPESKDEFKGYIIGDGKGEVYPMKINSIYEDQKEIIIGNNNEWGIYTEEKIVVAGNEITDEKLKENAEKAKEGAKKISDKVYKKVIPNYENTVDKIEERNRKLKEALDA